MNNLIVFDSFGNIKKSTNWWLIGFIALTIIGIGALLWYNWDKVKSHFKTKRKESNLDFSATISFNEESSILKINVQSKDKQEFSVGIVNNSLQNVSSLVLPKEDEEKEFDLSKLVAGKYQCVVGNGEKTIIQDFEKK